MLLTRAARKKGGHSPLPSLFKDALQLPKQPNPCTSTKETTIQVHPVTSDNFSSSEEEEEEEEEEKRGNSEGQLWVQCEHLSCRKWRLLNKGTNIDTNSAWYCHMHPDPTFQSCGIPEQDWKQSKKRRYTFTKLRAGQLVWAKMDTFSPWPAIVTPDPWSDNEHFSEDRIGCIYHVEFLGRNRTHLWLSEEKVEPYLSRVCSLGSVTVKTGPFKAAVAEADVLADVTDRERLKTCQYTEGYIATGGRKHTEGTLKFNTGKAQRRRKKAADCKAVSELSGAQDLASLEKVLSQSNFDLKEFIQTNFTIDSNGVVNLATSTSPKCADAKGKKAARKRRKRISTTTSSQSDGGNDGTPRLKPGRKPRQKNKNVHTTLAASKRISPTIPDYFNSLTPTPTDTGTGCSSGMVCMAQPPSHELADQVVPGAGGTGLSAEAQAMRELEEIEGMLTMFEESGSKVKPRGESGSKVKESGSKMKPGRGSDLTLLEDSQSEGELKRACGMKVPCEERTGTSNLEESANSEWMESVLGEIDQIEDLIQDLSKDVPLHDPSSYHVPHNLHTKKIWR